MSNTPIGFEEAKYKALKKRADLEKQIIAHMGPDWKKQCLMDHAGAHITIAGMELLLETLKKISYYRSQGEGSEIL